MTLFSTVPHLRETEIWPGIQPIEIVAVNVYDLREIWHRAIAYRVKMFIFFTETK